MQILVYSFETGREVLLSGGKRLSAHIRGDTRGNAVPGTAAIIAAEMTSDNGTLAVAGAGSGEPEAALNQSTAAFCITDTIPLLLYVCSRIFNFPF